MISAGGYPILTPAVAASVEHAVVMEDNTFSIYQKRTILLEFHVEFS